MIRRTVLALAVVLLLAGCQDDPEPKIAEPSASPTTSTSPVVSESAAPETAEAFIRRWRELAIAMQNSGDATTYRETTRGCKTCADFADQIETYYRAGGYVRVQGENVEAITQVDSVPSRAVFQVDLDPEPTEYVTQSGGQVMRLPGEPLSFEVVLKPMANGWRLVDYQQLAK